MKKYIAMTFIIILILSGCTAKKQSVIVPESSEFAPPNCVFDYNGEAYKSFVRPDDYDSHFKDVRLLPTTDTVDVAELKVSGQNYPDDYKLLSFTGKVYIPQNDIYCDFVFVKNADRNVFYPFIKQKAPEPTAVQTSQLSSDNIIFDYNGKTYSHFHSPYGYEYYFGDTIRLMPTYNTVKVWASVL